MLAFHLGILPGGGMGVDLFFVLSGFLITNLLIEEWRRRDAIDLKQFYLRRALRLLPAFVALLLVFTVHTLLLCPAQAMAARWYELAVAACYVSNWNQLHGASMSMLGHTWSLSVEEQFYLLWPALLCFMLRKGSRRQIVGFVIAGIVASAALRAGLHNQHRFLNTAKIDIMRLYAGLDTRADALLVGCLASLLVTWNLLPRSRRFVGWVQGASMVAMAVLAFCLFRRDLNSSQNYDGLFTVVALAAAIVILRLLVAPPGVGVRILESAPLVAAGRISYGLYLFHVPVIDWLGSGGLGWQHPVNVAWIAVCTLAAALLSFFLIERPFLQLKHRLGAAKKATVATASAFEPSRRAA